MPLLQQPSIPTRWILGIRNLVLIILLSKLKQLLLLNKTTRIWWFKIKLMRYLRSKKKLNLRRTFRQLMVFPISTSHLKHWRQFLLLETKTTKWKMMRYRMMERRTRIMLIQAKLIKTKE